MHSPHQQLQSRPLRVNDLVMAKMRTYCAWPAQVIDVKGKRTEVYFFGTAQKGTVNTANVKLFIESHQKIRRLLPRLNPQFIKAIREVETILEIPEENSILNTNSIS